MQTQARCPGSTPMCEPGQLARCRNRSFTLCSAPPTSATSPSFVCPSPKQCDLPALNASPDCCGVQPLRCSGPSKDSARSTRLLPPHNANAPPAPIGAPSVSSAMTPSCLGGLLGVLGERNREESRRTPRARTHRRWDAAKRKGLRTLDLQGITVGAGFEPAVQV